MLDRVATAAASLQRQSQIQQMRSELNRLTNEISSGALENPAGRLGAGASVLYRLHIDEGQQTALKTTINTASQRIGTMQTALTSMSEVAKEMAAATLNVSSASGSGLKVLAAQGRSALAQVNDLLNTQYDGHAVFAGSDSNGTPMAGPGVMETAARNLLADQAAAAGGALEAGADIDALLADLDNYFDPNATATFTSAGGPQTLSYKLSPDALAAYDTFYIRLEGSDGTSVDLPLTATPGSQNTTTGTTAGVTYTATLLGEDSVGAPGVSKPAGAMGPSFDVSAFVAQDDGQPTKVMIGATSTTSYDVKANQDVFRGLMQGLSMLSLLDSPSAQMSDAAKKDLMERAGSLLDRAKADLATTQGVLGSTEQRLTRATSIQQAAVNATTQQILELEQADPYTNAERLETLRTQLQATYAVTAQISELSLVNFLR